ncbi:hypothetical protein M5K25_017196 [Dendrobium thyrsiflorum]|uniref:Reverse transcriptase zinc-binding domain-containing protein n=1 Tax=Dendrobium thyrsiflorum TaxID=117978 RepID=A0ABD0UMG1_DENTH
MTRLLATSLFPSSTPRLGFLFLLQIWTGVLRIGASLVGYSVGPRPTYLSLQNAIKKVWSIKGSVELLSLNDGFFLFKFTSPEDFEVAWSGGPWFFFGRPFILQKWTPKFKPKRDECNSIPIWIKIVDLPLAVWNPLGISKIASFVGHPLAVDALTARKTRLTFARVCVLVNKVSSFPDEIPISMDDDEMSLKVLYDWKQVPCAACGSLVHPSNLCHKNPQPKPPAKPPNRGRSSSRTRPALTNPQLPPKPQTLLPSSVTLANAILPTPINNSSLDTIPNPSTFTHPITQANPPENSLLAPLPPSLIPELNTTTEDPIPNLNSPLEDVSSSDNLPASSSNSSHTSSLQNAPTSSLDNSRQFNSATISPNKFSILQLDNQLEPTSQGACPSSQPQPDGSPVLGQSQKTQHAKSTRAKGANSQLIHGTLLFGATSPILLSVVYATNNPADRIPLWHQLSILADSISTPWIVMGDFNCFREPNDKSGGVPTHFSRLGEFNNWVFNYGTADLKSTGLRYTWFNRHVDDPIHIKLDRMLVNQNWLDCFPFSFYKVIPPTCSDHSPLLLCSGNNSNSAGRFQFKNYWINMDDFWEALISSFAIHHVGSPISILYAKLRALKLNLKNKNWANDHFIKTKLTDLYLKHKDCLDLIQGNLIDYQLNASLKAIRSNISFLHGAWCSWTIQRAKALWLQHGEDDLGFLYARRTQFLRFTVANTLAYWIRGAIIPKSCMKYIDRLCSRFLYHGSIEGKKLHLVAWHNTCLPTCYGGLGIPDIHSLYFGFGCSFIWRMYNTNSLVFDWLRRNYLSPWKPLPVKVSKFWKFIHQIAGKIKNYISFVVAADSSHLSLFWDPWVDGKLLAELFSPVIGISDCVKDFVDGHSWCLPDCLPSWLRQTISAIPISDASSASIVWKSIDKPCFKSFRLLFFADLHKVPWFKFVWHKRAVLRYSSYSWLMFRNGLKTADILAKRNISIQPTCPLCQRDDENYAHLFFSCDYSFSVISQLLPILDSFLFRPSSMQLFEFLKDISIYNSAEKNFCYFVI